MEVDYGEPVDAVCRETAPDSGIFVRQWSHAHVQMDCNVYKGTITMTSP